MTKRKRNIMKEFRIDEISAVDFPAQRGAKAVIMKREDPKRVPKGKPGGGQFGGGSGGGNKGPKGVGKDVSGSPIRVGDRVTVVGGAKGEGEVGTVKSGANRSIIVRLKSGERSYHEGNLKVKKASDVELIAKRLAMSTMTAGHAHLIIAAHSSMGSAGELRAGKTSFVEGHDHDWLMDDAGNIILGDSQGHTHGIAAIVMKAEEELEEDSEEGSEEELEEEADDEDEGELEEEEDEVPPQARKRILPQGGTLAKPLGKDSGLAGKELIMDEKEMIAQMEALQKRADRAEKLAELSDAEKVFLKGLTTEEQGGFLALDSRSRTDRIKKAEAANQVEYTDLDGQVYRKNDDPRLIALAKRSDDDRRERLRMEEKAGEAELQKLAAELSHLPGEEKGRKALLKSVLALPAQERDEALKALRAQDKAFSKAFVSKGTSSAPSSDSAEASIDELAKAVREKHPNLTEAQAMVKAMESPQGQALYAKHIGLEDR